MTAPSVWAISFRRAPDRPDVVHDRHQQDRQHAEPQAGRQVRRQLPAAARRATARRANTRAIDATTASPPRRGIGRSWTLRAPGMSIAPTRTARRATSGVSANARAAATSAGRMNQIRLTCRVLLDAVPERRLKRPADAA